MTSTTEPPKYADDLARYLGEDSPEQPSQTVTECAEEAGELVTRHIGEASVPEVIVRRAVVEVGAELFHRRSAPSGIRQYASEFGATSVRLARDPMVAAYPLLRPYLPAGIA